MADRVQFRRDTAVNWYAYNPILLEGEVAYDLDGDQYKVGDGEHAWRDLPYRGLPCVQQKGNSTTTPMSQKAVTDELNTLDSKVAALAAGLDVTLSFSPNIIYKGVSTPVTLTGTMLHGTPSEMKLMDGSTVLQTSTVSPITKSVNVDITANSKAFKVVGTADGVTVQKEASVNARYPIYYGFAASASALAVDANRYVPTISAAHTYERTSTADGQHFYILVPSDISALTEFTMGGTPFVMTSSTETINGITYKVYTSGNVYNAGTKITVVAS